MTDSTITEILGYQLTDLLGEGGMGKVWRAEHPILGTVMAVKILDATLARDEALSYLNSLNTREGISTRFSEIAKATGNTAYDPAPNTRTIVVNVRTQENNSFKQMPMEDITDSDEATYPFTFNLTITQRFESADPMAISAAKAP